MTRWHDAGAGRGRSTPARALRGLLVGVLAAVLLGCGATGPSSVPASSASPAPGVGTSSPDPSTPRWPGTTVLAVIALGAADTELKKAGDDLLAAAEASDPVAMRGAADGLAKLIDDLTPQLERLEAYEGTRAIAALYRVAFPRLGGGAKQLRDSIDKGDAAGIRAGSIEINRGLADYALVRPQLGPLVEQALLQQRLLTK